MSHISLETGFYSPILHALKSVTNNMNPVYKQCIISFDEIKLQKGLTFNPKLDKIVGYEDCPNDNERAPNLATHALVFMVRGLCRKWKQVFGSFF